MWQIDAFDESAFKSSLLRMLGDSSGLSADDITLNITAASLHILVMYTTRDADLAERAVNEFTTIAHSTPQQLSSSLGVTVVSNGEVSSSAVAVTGAENPGTPSDGDERNDATLLAGGVLAAIAVTGAFMCWSRNKFGQGRGPQQLLNTLPVVPGGSLNPSPYEYKPRTGANQWRGTELDVKRETVMQAQI